MLSIVITSSQGECQALSSFVADELTKEGFLVLSNQVQTVNKVNSGLCPHGLPPAACPICSKMGGGSMRVGERPQKTGEMSYHQCAMIGNMMRARELAEKRHAQQLEHHADAMKNFENVMTKLSANLQNFIQQMNSNFFTKPIAFFAQNLILPVTNFVQNIPKIVQNFRNLKIDIQDKLNAIFGEVKNFIQKKISDIMSAVKSKLDGLFKIFKKHNADDDDTKIDDDKKIFNLKTILHKIIRKKKHKDERNSQDKQ